MSVWETEGHRLAGTEPFAGEAPESLDFAALMVAAIDAYLERALEAAKRERAADPLLAPQSAAQHADLARARRAELARITGVAEPRVVGGELEPLATLGSPSLIARGPGYGIHAIRWPVLPGLDGEGLLLEPERPPRGCLVAIPDADQTPEQFTGLVPSERGAAPVLRLWAEAGWRVVVPALVDRRCDWSGNEIIGWSNQPHREFIYRMAFELGRHLIGYEVQKLSALVDQFSAGATKRPVALAGYGEGGLLALVAGALDERIGVVLVSGYFHNQRRIWQEPIYRDVWQGQRGASDAQLAALVAPRPLVVEAAAAPVVDGPPPAREGRRDNAAAGRLGPIPFEAVRAEAGLARRCYQALGAGDRLVLVDPGADAPPFGPDAMAALARALDAQIPDGATPARPTLMSSYNPDAAQARQKRQFEQLCDCNQSLLRRSAAVRQKRFWATLDPKSPASWREQTASHRKRLWDDVIGRLPAPNVPARPRSRLAYARDAWRGYEVLLDVWPGVFAYGLLLLPSDLAPGERRPVIVCQHGLEGRPRDLLAGGADAYSAYAERLVERGYVVYAPQNPYIGGAAFRVLQRKAHPLGLSLFSFIIGQHQRTLEWLGSLPFVDAERIAFYGLSYGGKTAMRVPAVLDEYCLSICSADFNEWVVKTAGLDLPMSYLNTIEYDMYEFDLAHACNYAEMAALIAPRPFMVERGHDDGVGLDEWVAFEYAKVRRLYAKLGRPERTEIAFFDGPHKIDGRAAFAFLDRHLRSKG